MQKLAMMLKKNSRFLLSTLASQFMSVMITPKEYWSRALVGATGLELRHEIINLLAGGPHMSVHCYDVGFEQEHFVGCNQLGGTPIDMGV